MISVLATAELARGTGAADISTQMSGLVGSTNNATENTFKHWRWVPN